MFLCLKTTKAIPQNRQVGDGFCCQCAYYYSADFVLRVFGKVIP